MRSVVNKNVCKQRIIALKFKAELVHILSTSQQWGMKMIKWKNCKKYLKEFLMRNMWYKPHLLNRDRNIDILLDHILRRRNQTGQMSVTLQIQKQYEGCAVTAGNRYWLWTSLLITKTCTRFKKIISSKSENQDEIWGSYMHNHRKCKII